MASGLLSLKWNNHRSTFFHVLSSIRSKESYCDATLACDGRFYPVHKLVLSTCSEYFEQIFERTQCKHPVIVLKDIKHDDLEALMNYMYVGEVNVLQERLAGLIKAAECLKIKGLAVPDEDPLSSKEKRNQTRGDFESPHAKRRRREEVVSYEDRPVTSRSSRISHREQQQQSAVPHIENLPDTSAAKSDVVDALSETQNQCLESESDQPDGDHGHGTKHRRASSGSSSQRSSSHKPIPEISLDESSVKTEPPDIQDEEVDNKETLHSNLGFDPSGDGDSMSAGPASVASGSNDACFSDSNALESTPQSVEDVVAQAIPPTSTSFQGNSFPLWEGEGNMQNFPGEGYSGENSQARPMLSSVIDANSSKRGAEPSSEEQSTNASPETAFDTNSSSRPYPQPASFQPTSVSSINYAANFHDERIKNPLNKRLISNVSKLHFKPPAVLKQQKPIPTNFKSYNCPNCSYRSLRKQDLLYHFRTHTGEKPYACPFCPHKSSVMSNMKTHIRRRHSHVS